jgi:hypothetical protein
MRTWSLAAAAAALGLLPIGASADDITRSNNQVAVDFAETNFGYKEIGNGILGAPGAPLDSESGWLPGVSASVSLMQDFGLKHLYFSARYSYLTGSTGYTGASLLGGGGFGSLKATDGANLQNVDLRLGKGFELGGSIMVTPFFGGGYQYWQRAVNTGEDYSHGYYGGGLLVQVNPVKALVVSAEGLVGQTFESHISASPIPLDPIGFSGALRDSTIYKAGASADYAVTTLVHVNAGVEYENFAYGMYCCNAIGFGEPNSRTTNVTFRVGAGIAFGGSDYYPLK